MFILGGSYNFLSQGKNLLRQKKMFIYLIWVSLYFLLENQNFSADRPQLFVELQQMLKLIISKVFSFFRTIAPIPCYLGIDPCVKFIKHSSVKSGNRKEIPLELHILSAQTSFSKPELWSEYRCIHAVSYSHKLVVKRSGFVPV